MAIKAEKLTPYYYYPIPITLEDDEYQEYMKITKQIVKFMANIPDSDDVPKSIEMLLIKRARIIAGAREKITALKQIIQDRYSKENQMLIYCGATTVSYSMYKEGVVDDNEKRQIEVVLNMLGNDIGMKVTKFTSEESSKEREIIKEKFSKGNMLQAIVAIRCLDEGINIPGIKTAFILASSTNPKEYIQRRGRVLRRAEGKDFAYIYDFVTLPKSLDGPKVGEQDGYEISLIKREFQRVEEFAAASENYSDSMKLLDKINKYYNIY